MKKHLVLSLLMGLSIFLTDYAKAQLPLLDAKTLAETEVFTSLKDALNQADTVYILDLGGQKLKSFPAEILQLSKLQKLILYGNELASIPEEIAQLTNLQFLDLYDNRLKKLTQRF